MTIENKDRSTLAGLADVLIPASAGFPSASQVGVAAEGLDQVLAVRPDLAKPLKVILQSAKGRNPAEVVAQLQDENPASFAALAEIVAAALAEIVAGAYFMNPQVRVAIGYHGQVPQPLASRPDHLNDGLLQPVIDRGPIYRPTPRTNRDR